MENQTEKEINKEITARLMLSYISQGSQKNMISVELKTYCRNMDLS